MSERRFRQQGIDRALGLLHRQIGRNQQRVDEYEYRLRDRVRAAMDSRERTRRTLEARLRRFDMRPRLAADRRRMEAVHVTAVQLLRTKLMQRRGKLEQLAAKLSQLSPLRILDRGYAIVSNQTGIVTDPAQAPPQSTVQIQVSKGRLNAVVLRPNE
jgi:exodeoxyribonuclease VII large subunit